MLWVRLKWLETQLSSPEEATRCEAIRELGDSEDERAVAPLLALFEPVLSGGYCYPDHQAAMEALAKLKDPRAVEVLVPLMLRYGIEMNHDSDQRYTLAAARALESLGWRGRTATERAVFALTLHVQDSLAAETSDDLAGVLSDAGWRWWGARTVAAALALRNDVRAVLPLVLWHEKPAAMTALQGLGSAAVDTILAHVPVPAELPQVASWFPESALQVLVKLGAAAVPSLLEALGGDEPARRDLAVKALGRIGDRRAEEAIRRLIGDASAGLRVAALQALEDMGVDPTGPLIECLRHDVTEVRVFALFALADLGDGRAVPELIKLCADDTGNQGADLPARAAVALASLRHPAALSPLLRILETRRGPLGEAIRGLGRLGDPEATEHLLRQLETMTPEDSLRTETLCSLARLGHGKSCEGLVKILQDPPGRYLSEIHVHEADVERVVEACQKSRDALMAALEHKPAAILTEALHGLADLGDSKEILSCDRSDNVGVGGTIELAGLRQLVLRELERRQLAGPAA